MHHPFYHRNLTCLLSLKTGCVAAVLGEFEGESGYLVEDTPINLSVCSLSVCLFPHDMFFKHILRKHFCWYRSSKTSVRKYAMQLTTYATGGMVQPI